MMDRIPLLLPFLLFFLLLLVSCSSVRRQSSPEEMLLYLPREDGTLLSDFAPAYLVDNPAAAYNRIGTPSAYLDGKGREHVVVDPAIPSLFVEQREFTTNKQAYTNLIYRVHFQQTPPDLLPFRLGAGNNPGLLLIITLDRFAHPVLYTTVHACGCYLAFFPTSYLGEESFPEKWPRDSQVVYGMKLPAFLGVDQSVPDRERVVIALQDGSHRVMGIFPATGEELRNYASVQVELYPVESLEAIPVEGNGVTSFFFTSGAREGYVKNSTRWRERILMSWWTLDWRIGEDKKLGKNKDDPPVFFTSLRLWARDSSDLRDFPAFLSYWGWKL